MIMEQRWLSMTLMITTTSLYVHGDNALTMQTKLGPVTGLSETKTIEGATYHYNVFRGIPYAKPPIGEMRFQEPLPYGPWQGTLDARNFGASCIQPFVSFINITNQSEDCLYLNIYVPKGTSTSSKKSVMIWIHGGGYIYGDGTSFDTSYLSVIGDVIVVTLNYRLNVFGFLSTADDLIPGNYGLWDQKLAIQWVNHNIDIFGGDLKSITIFGESAGAFSVALHTIHPQNRGLFSRAIMQSGTSNSIRTTSLIPRVVSRNVMEALSCGSNFTKETLKCAKSKSSIELYDAYIKSMIVGDGTLSVHILLAYAPVVDGKFLDDTPSNILNNRNSPGFELYKSLDVIIGNDESEGSLLFGYLNIIKNNLPFKLKDGIPSDYFCNHIVSPFVTDYYVGNMALIPAICNKYSATSSIQQGRNAVDFFGDVTMYTPAVQSLNAHAVRNNKSKQYQYIIRRNTIIEQYPWFRGAPHAAEVQYLFPNEVILKGSNSVDVHYGIRLMKYWSNFAKTGLCRNLSQTTNSKDKIQCSKIFDSYQTVCRIENITAVHDNTLSKLISLIFNNVKKGRFMVDGTRHYFYVGITWKLVRDMSVISSKNISLLIAKIGLSAMVVPSVMSRVEVFIPSDIIVNGNIVMKELKLDFEKHLFSLTIRSKDINVDNLFMSNRLNEYAEDVSEILEIVNKLKICKGILLAKKHVLPFKVIHERINTRGDENSQLENRVRCCSCKQVLSWLAVNDTCRSCCQQLNNILEDSDYIQLDKIGDDLKKIFEIIFPGASPEMQDFLQNQHTILSSSPGCNKWEKSTIKTCLNLWSRNAKSYEELRDSNIFKFPSGRHLRRFKNAVDQKPGINDQILHWMYNSAKSCNLSEGGHYGGIIHDEAKIQEDLVISVKGKKNELIGWIDTGTEAELLKIIKEGGVKKELATDVLQLTFLGNTGFRFPFAHFPTNDVKGSELYILIWEAISKLQSWGFYVQYIMQDGGGQNREFTKIHFKGDPKLEGFLSEHLTRPGQMIAHCQDYSHNMKKIRNSVLSSGNYSYSTRLIQKDEYFIVWDHWIEAIKWDEQTNSRKVYYKLTSSHLHPDSGEKMRNHLADEVLNEDMLHLMKQYQMSLHNGKVLNGSIEFLEKTAIFVKVFRDPRPITNVNDTRLADLKSVLSWFQSWRMQSNRLTTKAKSEKLLPSSKCLDDVESLLCTFLHVCKIHFDKFKGAEIVPSRFNSDVAENIFCQQRGVFNGNNSNPNYYNYCSTMNNIILCQSSKSRARKSNAGLVTTQPFSIEPSAKKPRNIRV